MIPKRKKAQLDATISKYDFYSQGLKPTLARPEPIMITERGFGNDNYSSQIYRSTILQPKFVKL